MVDLVSATDIERIVGRDRHPTVHLGRVVSAENTVYILHSKACVDSGHDLRECRYSKALGRGTSVRAWDGLIDRPVPLAVWAGLLAPSTIGDSRG